MPARHADRRRRLAEQIGSTGIAIVPAATEVIRNHDVTTSPTSSARTPPSGT
jgi:hypothetical protein